MDNDPEDATPDLERLKADRDFDIKQRELGLKERELEIRRSELKLKAKEGSIFRNPILYTIVVAAIGAYGTIFTSFRSSQTQEELETRKADGTLILEMIKTGGDPEKAARNLTLLVDAKLLHDKDQRNGIVAYLASRKPGEGASLGQESVPGPYGPDMRQPLNSLPDSARATLLGRFGAIGVLKTPEGKPACNAFLVGKDQIIVPRFCFYGGEVGYSFATFDDSGNKLSAMVRVRPGPKESRSTFPLAVGDLDQPLGEKVGWLKTFQGPRKVGDQLSFVAYDLVDQTDIVRNKLMISGPITGDTQCVVVSIDQANDEFEHRCPRLRLSGGAPVFDAVTGDLVGVISHHVPARNVATGIDARAIPKALSSATPVSTR